MAQFHDRTTVAKHRILQDDGFKSHSIVAIFGFSDTESSRINSTIVAYEAIDLMYIQIASMSSKERKRKDRTRTIIH